MTLEAYNSDRLDALSLRTLDLCARVRNLARVSRDEQLPAVELHDRKALEWLQKIEEWAIGAEAEMHRRVEIRRGERHADRMVKSSRRK